MNFSEECVDKIYQIFRRKMHDVYRKNYKVEVFGNSMIAEFNAWQSYLRESLRLVVLDAEPGDRSEVVRTRDSKAFIKVMNPSNGGSHGHEYILVPEDLASRILVLDELPEEIRP